MLGQLLLVFGAKEYLHNQDYKNNIQFEQRRLLYPVIISSYRLLYPVR